MAGENWTFWLNMTNFALGMVTVVALVLVFSAVGWDLLVRKVHTVRTPTRLGSEHAGWRAARDAAGIAQHVRTRLGADDGRRRRENRAGEARGLRRETREVNYGMPVSERRSSAILPCCSGAEVDSRWTRSDGWRTLCFSGLPAVHFGHEG